DEELRALDGRRNSLEQQRVFLEAQLALLKPNSAVYSDSGERILSPADRLKMLKSQLASAQARYAPDHPDIARFEREIAGLQNAGGANPPGGAAATQAHLANDLQRDLQSARAQLAQAAE